MTRIEDYECVTAGVIADSDTIRSALKSLSSEELRVGTTRRDRGKLIYFDARVDGYRVEIAKQRNAPLGLLYVRGETDSSRSRILERILTEMSAVEIDANYVYDEFERMVFKK